MKKNEGSHCNISACIAKDTTAAEGDWERHVGDRLIFLLRHAWTIDSASGKLEFGVKEERDCDRMLAV
jgi:hypothetical protein